MIDVQTLIVAVVVVVVVGGALLLVSRRGRMHDRPGRAGVLSRRWLMEHDRDEKL